MTFDLSNQQEFINQALIWASEQEVCMLLNGNNIPTFKGCFPQLLAVGKKEEFIGENGHSFELLDKISKSGKHLFGFLSYDLKNETEQLSSRHENLLQFPDLYFFEPIHLLKFSKNKVEIISDNPQFIYDCIVNSKESDTIQAEIKFEADTSREEYIDKFSTIRNHIYQGDIYELNYCIRFEARNAQVRIPDTYIQLNDASPAPFSVFFNDSKFSIFSASPERFLKKEGNKILSQPMKGTAKRGHTEEEDLRLKSELATNEKEQAENLMIVDLVRNDLTKSCEYGTVNVEELFGIYSFKNVHQMISTVSGTLRSEQGISDSIKNAYPMGSMTGAPKIRAMQLIDKYENSYRGIFSGTAGYIDPHGNFDFNVLIRSLYYNKTQEKLSFSVGSAITYDATAENEYKECLLKAQAILDLF